MRRPPRWGRAADPEPRVIPLLRGLQDLLQPTGSPGGRLQKTDALAELAQVLKAWDERESVSELRDMLGVAPTGRKAKSRRTLRVVQQEMELIDRLIGLALKGKDVSNYRKAADALQDVDEKRVERVWKEWGDLRTHSLHSLAKLHPEFSEHTNRTLTLLPPIPSDSK